MPIDVAKLKEIGKDIKAERPKSEIQPIVLAILRKNTKAGNAVTQKEVAGVLTEKLDREIKPQQARSALTALQKQGKAARLVLPEPDKDGNKVFWFIPEKEK